MKLLLSSLFVLFLCSGCNTTTINKTTIYPNGVTNITYFRLSVNAFWGDRGITGFEVEASTNGTYNLKIGEYSGKYNEGFKTAATIPGDIAKAVTKGLVPIP